MGEVVHEIHFGGMMLVVLAPGGGSKEYTVQIGDYGDIESFVPRHAFSFAELPIVGRLMNMAYPWIFQHQRSS